MFLAKRQEKDPGVVVTMLEVTLFLIFLLLLLLAKAYGSTYGYWRGKGIRYLSIPEYVQLVYDNFTKPVYEVAKKNYKKYGRVYGYCSFHPLNKKYLFLCRSVNRVWFPNGSKYVLPACLSSALRSNPMYDVDIFL